MTIHDLFPMSTFKPVLKENLSKEGLEHFIDVANNVLKMKDFDHE